MFDQLSLFEYLTETDENPPREEPEAVEHAPRLATLPKSADAPAQSMAHRGTDSLSFIETSVQCSVVSRSTPVKRGVAAADGSEEIERIFHLEQALDQALQYLEELRARVKHQTILEEQVALTEDYAYVQYQAIARLKADLSDHKDIIQHREKAITDLESDKSLAQTNLLSLQQDQLGLRQENAQWKNACQELQQECDRQHRKMVTLEEENTAMQEQILQQARQANEQETAVQYWKDQYTTLQQHVSQIKQVIDAEALQDNENSQPTINLLQLRELLNLLTLRDEAEPRDDSHALSMANLSSYSIPDFLIRRYRHRSIEPSTAEPDKA